jgi:hypothetical protein
VNTVLVASWKMPVRKTLLFTDLAIIEPIVAKERDVSG